MSARKGGLGRGLDALIPQSNIPSDIKTSTGQLVADRNEIDVNQILPNPKQPRTVFDEEQLAELALSAMFNFSGVRTGFGSNLKFPHCMLSHMDTGNRILSAL